jgi:hypothetical protein
MECRWGPSGLRLPRFAQPDLILPHRPSGTWLRPSALVPLLALALLAVAGPGAIGTAGAPVITREILALEGQPAPGGAPGETFGALLDARPRINRWGDVAFVAPVLGVRPDNTPVSVVFLRTAAGLVRVAQEDTLAPGLEGPLFGRFTHLALNDAGDVACLSRRSPTEAIFSNASGAWRVVADTLGPQASGLRFRSFSTVATDYRYPLLLRSSATAEVLFPAEAINRVAEEEGPGLWTADPDGWDPRALFVPGKAAPALPEPYLLNTLTHWGFGSDPARRSVFLGFLWPTGNEPVPTRGQTLWTSTGRGSLQPLARDGDRAPIPGSDVFYDELTHVSVNGDGDVAFATTLVPDGGNTDYAIVAGRPDALRVVARGGDPVNGPDGTPIGQLYYAGKPTLNAAGQILFEAGIPDRTALLRGSPGNRPEVVAIQGDAWPGAPSGWTLGPFATWNFNAAGRVAFVAEIVIPGNLEQSWGLWLTDAAGAPTLIALMALNPSAITPPAGVPVFSEGLPDATTDGLAGGSDGLPRFLGDDHGVVHVGRRPDQLSGLYLTHVDPDANPGRDETFRLTRITPGVTAPLEASDPASLTPAHAARLFGEDGLQARLDKDWTGARVRLEIEENLVPESDLLGLDPLGLERHQLAPGNSPSEITHQGIPLGTWSRPQPGVLVIDLGARATTEGLRGLLRTLGYASSRSLADTLRADPRHTEPRRILRLRITDAGGRLAEGTQVLVTPATTGLAFEGHGLDHRLWVSGNGDSSTVTLRLQLLLSNGARLTLGCAPAAADIQWIPNSAARNFTVETAAGAPCASATMTYSAVGGFPSIVRLQGWEALHLLRREEVLTHVFLEGPNACLMALLNAWIESQFTGPLPATHRLTRPVPGSVPPSPTPAPTPTDLQAGPYSLRAWMLRSTEGRRLIRLYEEHTGEVVTRLLADLGLLTDALALVREFQPALREFLAGHGARVIIRADMVAQLNRVWDRLATEGSPALRQAIEQERARFHGLQDFVGRSFADWGEMLGLGTPDSPFITVSSPRLESAAFHVEANRVNGLAYSLWRRNPDPDAAWEPVPNGLLRTADSTIQLTDPAPPATPRLYQVRTEPAPGAATATEPGNAR